MKLALITQDFPPEMGGIQTYSYEIAKRLAPRCEEFVLIAPDKPNAQAVDSQLDFEVLRVKTPNTLLGTLGALRVVRFLKKRKIDHIFHAQWQTLPISVFARKRGLVCSVTVAAHGREYIFNPFSGTKVGAKLYENYKKYLITKVDYFLPVSRYTSGILEQYSIPAKQQTVVMNGTNPNLFFPINNNALKEKYGYTGKQIILTTARLIKAKGLDTILRAIPNLVSEFPDLQYLIVGEGPYKADLERLTTDLGMEAHVKFTGRIPYEKVNEYYNLCDIYVMLSEIEAFGIVYLEAAACGKPSIGSRIGGIPDAIIENETGLLVEAGQSEELIEAIKRLLADDALRTRMGEAGRARVLREANWDRVGDLIFDLLTA